MHFVVLLRRVLDPEIPLSAFAVDEARKEPVVGRAPHVLSIFDGNALEVALRLREALQGGAAITALTFGPPEDEEVLRKALALTVDRAVHVVGPQQEVSAAAKAAILAEAIRTLPPPDLVLCGRQAADWEAGQIGGMVAEALALPALPFVSSVRPAAGGLEAVQQLEGGEALYRLGGAVVLTVTNDGQNVLRAAKIRDVMAARGREIRTLAMADLAQRAGVDPRAGQVELLSLRRQASGGRAELVNGDDPRAQARSLAARLQELGLI